MITTKAYIELDSMFPFFVLSDSRGMSYSAKEVDVPSATLLRYQGIIGELYEIQEELKKLYDSN